MAHDRNPAHIYPLIGSQNEHLVSWGLAVFDVPHSLGFCKIKCYYNKLFNYYAICNIYNQGAGTQEVEPIQMRWIVCKYI